jgi:hypothetical protein
VQPRIVRLFFEIPRLSTFASPDPLQALVELLYAFGMNGLANWLKTYESIAIWLEGVALVLILFLDWREYQKQGISPRGVSRLEISN